MGYAGPSAQPRVRSRSRSQCRICFRSTVRTSARAASLRPGHRPVEWTDQFGLIRVQVSALVSVSTVMVTGTGPPAPEIPAVPLVSTGPS